MSFHCKRFFDLIEALWGVGVHGKELVGQLQKLDPNESDGLDHFAFVRWYVDLVCRRVIWVTVKIT